MTLSFRPALLEMAANAGKVEGVDGSFRADVQFRGEAGENLHILNLLYPKFIVTLLYGHKANMHILK